MSQGVIDSKPKDPIAGEFIAVGPNGWARHEHKATAARLALRNSSRKLRKGESLDVFACTSDARVDYMGRLTATKARRVSGNGDFMTLHGELCED